MTLGLLSAPVSTIWQLLACDAPRSRRHSENFGRGSYLTVCKEAGTDCLGEEVQRGMSQDVVGGYMWRVAPIEELLCNPTWLSVSVEGRGLISIWLDELWRRLTKQERRQDLMRAQDQWCWVS